MPKVMSQRKLGMARKIRRMRRVKMRKMRKKLTYIVIKDQSTLTRISTNTSKTPKSRISLISKTMTMMMKKWISMTNVMNSTKLLYKRTKNIWTVARTQHIQRRIKQLKAENSPKIRISFLR